ncbi:carbohydrate ABC transporter permease [Diplocloster modestus]|uniref:Sugar ABC transporter permease n=1 Tax=Diplocloster modestus TaxID=2850322 RepID=A0ABS6KDN4_9FIRM|nr:sugar ABC transporter permease [Diplocloster modestus]MBU9728626.1 sugar ABC transporter permease [Diplocloster modestus]
MKWKKERPYMLFLVPAVLVYSVFLILPMLLSFYYALTDWDGLAVDMNFIGLRNFTYMFQDEGFRIAIRNTLIFVVMDIVIQNLLGLAFALLLECKIKTKNLLRAFYFIPVIMAPIVVSFIWTYLYRYDGGLFNTLLGFLGIGSVDYIGNPQYAIYFVILSEIWQWFSYRMIIYVAGLKNIPGELYEAAHMDGAGKIKSFFHVTVPMLIPSISINVMLCTIGALKQFDIVFTMTQGGPGYATEVITTKIYREAFSNMDMGYGTAIGVVLFAFILVVTILQNRFFNSREVEI